MPPRKACAILRSQRNKLLFEELICLGRDDIAKVFGLLLNEIGVGEQRERPCRCAKPRQKSKKRLENDPAASRPT